MFTQIILICFYFYVSLSLLCSDKNALSSPEQTETTEFVILGDRTGTHTPGVFPRVLASALESNPEFLIDVGDLIEGGTEDSLVLDTQWNEYMSLINHVKIPFYHTPGNHDLWFPGQMREYLARIGKPYYSFDVKNIHFIILNNSLWFPDSSQFIDNTQMNWLVDDLKNNNQYYTFVFCHKPFWDPDIVDYKIVNNALHSLFLAYNVDMVVTGHYHRYFDTEYDGIKYIIAGRAGGGNTVGNPEFTPKDVRFKSLAVEDHRFLFVTVTNKITVESHVVPTNQL